MLVRVNSPNVIGEVIDGEAVVIHLSTGAYYSLGDVGAIVWSAVSQRAGVDDLVALVAASYRLPPDSVANDIRGFVRLLLDEDLVAESEDPAGFELASEVERASGEYRSPRLEKFTDMEDLILLDPVHEVTEQGWPHASNQSA